MSHLHPRKPTRRPRRPDLLPSLRKALETGGSEVPERRAGPEAVSGDRPVVILGVGSELRSDDAAGVRAAERVAALAARRGLRGVHGINGGPAPENATAEIRQLSPSVVIIVDAASMGEPAGTIRVLDPAAVGGASFGTHGLSLTVLADYLRAEIGCRVILVGIQPASVEHGETMSEDAARAVEELSEALVECLG